VRTWIQLSSMDGVIATYRQQPTAVRTLLGVHSVNLEQSVDEGRGGSRTQDDQDAHQQ